MVVHRLKPSRDVNSTITNNDGNPTKTARCCQEEEGEDRQTEREGGLYIFAARVETKTARQFFRPAVRGERSEEVSG